MTEPEPRLPDPRMIPPVRSSPLPGAPGAIDASGSPRHAADDTIVRPFLVTGGRTRPLRDGLRIETMLVAPPSALSAPLRFELRRIVEICQGPTTVVDLAVALAMPLGVTKVLVGDLVTAGYLRCDDSTEVPLAVLERIRDRVRAL